MTPRPRLLGTAVAFALLASASQAGVIERACLQSDRAPANRAICACIQDAADRTLSRSDQNLAATFFRDPERAQDIRKSDTRAHDVFWERYRSFGDFAKTFCSRT